MKVTVNKPVEIEVKWVHVNVPVRYGVEDIPLDFPRRFGDEWHADIEVDTGKVVDWPIGVKGHMFMKVVDEGMYSLRDPQYNLVGRLHDYVPHGLIPGEYGDYIDLDIDENGIVKNWPYNPSVKQFFND